MNKIEKFMELVFIMILSALVPIIVFNNEPDIVPKLWLVGTIIILLAVLAVVILTICEE